MASRSRSTYRRAWSQGNASRICCLVHSSVGCSVTPKCTTRRRSCHSTTKAARFPRPMPGESSAVPTEDRVGLNHLQTSPPTGPESRQHNPQESVAAVEAQATRGVLLENRKLVTKREDLRLQGRTGSKTGGYQSEKGDEKRAHRGSHHDLTNDRNLFVFRSDGVFGKHRRGAEAFQSRPKLDPRTRIVRALEVSESSCERKLRDRKPSLFNAFEILTIRVHLRERKEFPCLNNANPTRIPAITKS